MADDREGAPSGNLGVQIWVIIAVFHHVAAYRRGRSGEQPPSFANYVLNMATMRFLSGLGWPARLVCFGVPVKMAGLAMNLGV